MELEAGPELDARIGRYEVVVAGKGTVYRSPEQSKAEFVYWRTCVIEKSPVFLMDGDRVLAKRVEK